MLSAGRWNLENTCSVTEPLCLLMFPGSLLEVIIGRELPVECSKLTCSAKVKKLAWYPGSEIDDRSWPLSVIVPVLRGRVQLRKGEK